MASYDWQDELMKLIIEDLCVHFVLITENEAKKCMHEYGLIVNWQLTKGVYQSGELWYGHTLGISVGQNAKTMYEHFKRDRHKYFN